MVTMNSDKAAIKRKPDSHTSGSTVAPIKEKPTPIQQLNIYDESPIMYQYRKIEKIIEKMHSETTGIPIRTVKSFMTSIPSVFTGSDVVIWIMKNLDIEDQQEALHLAHLIAAHGYIFPIDDHMLTVKNDGSYYRFQTLYFWPSNFWEPENTDYAIYLCKRTMQNKAKLALADYEAENLAKLQKTFSRKWEFIFMQAEAQSKVDKKRDKLERKVLDSQERAFWDLHRPMPGCVNTTEIDIRKSAQKHKHVKEFKVPQLSPVSKSNSDKKPKVTVESLKKQISFLKFQLDRSKIKVSKAAETFIIYYEQYMEYDPFLVATELPNPWVTDNTDAWDQENIAKDISSRRVKRWAFSLRELLADPLGRDHFEKFLHKEFSGENLKFWEAVQVLKAIPQIKVREKVRQIWNDYLAADAKCPVNVDSHSYELTKKSLENPDRWTYDYAAAHVYHLMKTDSYSRYLRSDMYKDYLNGSRKKTSVKGIRSIVSFSTKKDNGA